jgi:hypothetical protein
MKNSLMIASRKLPIKTERISIRIACGNIQEDERDAYNATESLRNTLTNTFSAFYKNDAIHQDYPFLGSFGGTACFAACESREVVTGDIYVSISLIM